MNRIALVTGGGRGIGFGISEKLADAGFKLAICGRKSEEEVADQLAPLQAKTEVLYCRCDISSADDRANLLSAIRERFGALHVLVNNAGIAPSVRADILDATEESFEQLIRVNLQGPYFLTQAAANWMVEEKQADDTFQGCIINVSSISATIASVNRGDYCISKAGVAMATQLYAARLGEYDIPVYEIRPGVTKTDMTAGVTEKYDKLIEEGLCVQKRWGFPEDVGKDAASLAQMDFPYSTGQVIMVDGGLTIGRL
ncbi:MAG: 3-ketoacyl-ACP reductase [Planctomycetota bacterium]|jgi:NAD(P)-dependent dehydrogenase (short-subunit alcohol dehydrogenase family)